MPGHVRFPHPASGIPTTGKVVGEGEHGLTVEDDGGQRHQVPHGRHEPYEPSEGPDEGERRAKEQGEGKERHEALCAHHGRLEEFRRRAHADLRLGAANRTAAVAACALLTEYTGRPVHHLRAGEVHVDGAKVSIDAPGNGESITDPRLASWLEVSIEGRKGPAFHGQLHDGEPVDVDGKRVQEYLDDHLGSDLKQIQQHHATRRWARATSELGPPKSKQQARQHAEDAAYKAAVDLRDVDPTTRKAHARFGLVPDTWGPDRADEEHGLGKHLRSVQHADPFEWDHKPE